MTDTTEIISPDNNQKLHFYDSIEPRMGMTMSKFSLTDNLNKEKIKFTGIWTIGYKGHSASWAENSNYFSLAIGIPFDCFLVVDITTKVFGVIKFLNVWNLDAKCYNDKIEIEFSDNQIPERIEHNKYPTRHFTKPKNLSLKFDELKWFGIDRLDNFKKIECEIEQYDLKPIDNGWREFKGILPQTTELRVWELKEFAKYGDKQSEMWLNELMTKTNDPNLWTKTSDYIGHKTRK